jgi:hypothetical protein
MESHGMIHLFVHSSKVRPYSSKDEQGSIRPFVQMPIGMDEQDEPQPCTGNPRFFPSIRPNGKHGKLHQSFLHQHLK